MRVFVTRPIPESGIALLRDAGHDVTVRGSDSPVTRGVLLQVLGEADALVSMLTERIDADLLAAAPSLRIVANFAVGTNNIDIAAATKRGIAVTNTPDVLTDATADLTLALILAASRRIVEASDNLRSRQWHGWGPLQFLGWQITGKTLGIVGPGRIATAVARRARGFDMKVVYTGRRRNEEFERATGAHHRDLDALLAEADVVSLHCPLTAETKHLIGERQLARMKPTAILVNTARGPVIDEPALARALRDRRIAAAGLDVFEEEPVVHAGLFDCPTAVLLPHIGSATIESRSAMADLCARNIIAFAAGEKPPTILNPEVLAQ